MSGWIRNRLNLWFGRARLDRRAYLVGLGSLVLLHYGLVSLIMWAATGGIVGPITVFSPFYSTHQAPLSHVSSAVYALLFGLSIAFAFAGTSMSVRRALDAGTSAWLGTCFLLPLVGVLVVLLLAVAPTCDASARRRPEDDASFLHLFLCAVSGAAIGLAICVVSVYGVHGYGAYLFLVTPCLMGFVVGYLYNRAQLHGEGSTIAAVVLSLLLTFGGLVLFAMEGLVCIAMAAPIAVPFAICGGVAGRMVARDSAVRMAHLSLLVLSLPVLMGAEKVENVTPLREVASAIDIDAPPEVVWPRVVGFTDLPPPSEIVFRLGIAYPRRARIEGKGVGAVRRCEFSTGAFVEPITRWEEPRRLSFDVVSQPHPMHEWSPYEHVHAPHLVGNMRSKRGEFRLVPLADGGTRLEGSTWYELEMFPQFYWTLWSDALVHAIHRRVLAHIKRLAEADAAAG